MSCCVPAGSPPAMDMMDSRPVHEHVKEYYGKTLQTSADLKTNACCESSTKPPDDVIQAMRLIHTDVSSRYYGCGLVVPEHLEGMRVLDLGSGAGQDCFVLSKLVGEDGLVTGVDMTDEQIEVAQKYIDYHREKFGYKRPNVEFRKGYLEKLDEAGLQKEFYDIIVSNCVINLCEDKHVVLKEAFRVLKEGGELYFSDVYADRILPKDIRQHNVLWGECIAGALWWQELHRLAEEVGFSQPRLVTASPIVVQQPKLKELLGDAKFVSVTYRLFKLPETRQEAGNVMYDGSITGHALSLTLDHSSSFPKDTPVGVDAELATILHTSRFSDAFIFQAKHGKTCCSKDIKMNAVDPFDWLERNGNAATSAGCCSGEKQKTDTCCPGETKSGCC